MAASRIQAGHEWATPAERARKPWLIHLGVYNSNVRLTLVLIYTGFKISLVVHGFSRISADFRRHLRICADVSQIFRGCFADVRGLSLIFADFRGLYQL